MKIQQDESANAARIGQVQPVAPPAKTPNGSAAASSTTESPAATVSFSTQAQDIAKATAAVNAAPDVREDLVSSLKARIDSGQYHVSGADVADMMMRRVAADNTGS
jgi:negative regulator of flagellin synthesis FlgM